MKLRIALAGIFILATISAAHAQSENCPFGICFDESTQSGISNSGTKNPKSPYPKTNAVVESCDLNADGRCDQVDQQIFQGIVNAQNQGGYNNGYGNGNNGGGGIGSGIGSGIGGGIGSGIGGQLGGGLGSAIGGGIGSGIGGQLGGGGGGGGGGGQIVGQILQSVIPAVLGGLGGGGGAGGLFGGGGGGGGCGGGGCGGGTGGGCGPNGCGPQAGKILSDPNASPNTEGANSTPERKEEDEEEEEEEEQQQSEQQGQVQTVQNQQQLDQAIAAKNPNDTFVYTADGTWCGPCNSLKAQTGTYQSLVKPGGNVYVVPIGDSTSFASPVGTVPHVVSGTGVKIR